MKNKIQKKPENKPFEQNSFLKKAKKQEKNSFFRFYFSKFSAIIFVVIIIDNLESSDHHKITL